MDAHMEYDTIVEYDPIRPDAFFNDGQLKYMFSLFCGPPVWTRPRETSNAGSARHLQKRVFWHPMDVYYWAFIACSGGWVVYVCLGGMASV